MTATNFKYWLQGFFELTGVFILDEKQTEIVGRHLATVTEKDEFCEWLRGVIDGQPVKMIPAAVVVKVAEKLTLSFLQVTKSDKLMQDLIASMQAETQDPRHTPLSSHVLIC